MSKLFFIIGVLFVLSCTTTSAPENICYSEKDPPRNYEKVSIRQGIWGNIWFWKGDFMPVGRGEICQVKRAVYINELATIAEAERVDYSPFYSRVNTELIATGESGEDGFFQIELESGTYSVFVMEDGYLYANSYGSGGEISPVIVEGDSISEVHINITSEATF